MNVTPDMVCCKPGRQSIGLACEPGWMVFCLAGQCAKLPTLEERRRFADNVARVKLLADPVMQEQFRAQVRARFTAIRRAG